jgi:hypothetical protein
LYKNKDTISYNDPPSKNSYVAIVQRLPTKPHQKFNINVLFSSHKAKSFPVKVLNLFIKILGFANILLNQTYPLTTEPPFYLP